MAETVEGRVNFGWQRLEALYLGDLKLVSGARPALYDLAHDPTETQDVAAANPPVVARLESRLQALRRDEPRLLSPVTGTLGDETTQLLAALGYIVTDALTMPASGPGPDPRDMMRAMRRLMQAVNAPVNADEQTRWFRFLAWTQGIGLPRNNEELISVLQAMEERDPSFAPTLYFLSVAYTKANRPEDVTRALERLEAVKRAASGAE
jgi:hypothetical protein